MTCALRAGCPHTQARRHSHTTTTSPTLATRAPLPPPAIRCHPPSKHRPFIDFIRRPSRRPAPCHACSSIRVRFKVCRRNRNTLAILHGGGGNTKYCTILSIVHTQYSIFPTLVAAVRPAEWKARARRSREQQRLGAAAAHGV